MQKLSYLLKNTFESSCRYFSPYYCNKMAVNWHVSNNFGDLLSVYIAKKLSGMSIHNVTELSNHMHYHIIGSILSLANKKSLVWGTGFANKSDSFIQMPKKIFMVRGEYSLEICRGLGVKDDIALGDPGYIISRIYQPIQTIKRYKLGVIPHWVDYELCKEFYKGRDDIHVINLLNTNIEAVIDQIYACEQCISSSLHGIVVAHSYDIPCMHVTFSDHIMKTGLKKYNLAGDGVKYSDYFSSVKIPEYAPMEITSPDVINDIMRVIPKNCGDKKQIDIMMASCPFIKESGVVDAYH